MVLKRLILAISLATGISSAQTYGPVSTQQFNYIYLVSGPTPNNIIHVGGTDSSSALATACADNSGVGQVVIQQGANPSDAPPVGGGGIGSTYTITGGCANVTILDWRGTSGVSLYAYTNSTTYTQVSLSSSGSSTIVPSPQFQVPYYSTSGTSDTLTGDPNFTDNAGLVTAKNTGAGGTSVFINPDAADAFGASGLGITNIGYALFVNTTSGYLKVLAQAGALGNNTLTIPKPTSGTTDTFCMASGAGGGDCATLSPGCPSVTFSATPTFAYTSPCLALTLTGNVTSSTATGFSAGKNYALFLVQDSTGGRTFVPPTTFKGWPTAINLAANGKTVCIFTAYTDSNLYLQNCNLI